MDITLRNICLVRHAKSSWDFPMLPDIERPLNGRGNRDAPFMAAKLNELGITPDVLISSPAVRAHTTAKYFRKEFNLEKGLLHVVSDLYGAGPDDIVDIVRGVSDEFMSVFVFGHNPTMTMLANMFPGVSIDNVPTCGILQAKSMVDKWEKWTPDTSAFTGFYYPKQYFQL